jgi:hypothetical protein
LQTQLVEMVVVVLLPLARKQSQAQVAMVEQELHQA